MITNGYEFIDLIEEGTEFISQEININLNKTNDNFQKSARNLDLRRVYGSSEETVYKIDKIKTKEKRKSICAIICVKDSIELLTCLYENFEKYSASDFFDVILVDDRSVSDQVYDLTMKFGHSYMKVSYDGIFNFSMVNNFGANLAHNLGYERVIFWNSDLWIRSREDLENYFKNLATSNDKLIGAKLVYPPSELSFKKGDHYVGIREKIQFGGSIEIFNSSLMFKSVIHGGVGKDPDIPLFSENRYDIFMTGAMINIDLNHFKDLKGFNPNLKINFQDVDLCFRSSEKRHYPYLIFKNCSFYHDEGVSLDDGNIKSDFDTQKKKDAFYFLRLWSIDRQEKISSHYTYSSHVQLFEKLAKEHINKEKK